MASLKQQTYRRLMKEQKTKSTAVQRIQHPLAKYNSLGQLSCVLCSTSIKSELLWQTHLQSKRHKESLVNMKTKKQPHKPPLKSISTQQPKQSPVSHNEELTSKSINSPTSKRICTTEEIPPSKKSKVDQTQEKEELISSSGLPSDFFDASISNDKREVDTKPNETQSSSSSVLPPDYFDKTEDTGEIDESSDEKKSKDSEAIPGNELPEGFFDDPKVDAKVRKVEYKDPQDSVWEAFQKSISKETEVSTAIIEEGDEEMKIDRELTEVNEQVVFFQRAEQLRLRQEQLQVTSSIKQEPNYEENTKEIKNVIVKNEVKEEEEEEEEEVDLDELLDWRSKHSS